MWKWEYSNNLMTLLLKNNFVYQDNKRKKGKNKDKGLQTSYSSSTDIPGRQYDPDLHPLWKTPVSRVTRKPPALENWQDTRGNRRRRNCLHSQVNLKLTKCPILARSHLSASSVTNHFLRQVSSKGTPSPIQEKSCFSATSVTKNSLGQVT